MPRRLFKHLRERLRRLVHPRTARSAPPWQREQVVCDADEYLDALVQDLAAARSSITFEVYILGDDAIGQRVVGALIAAAARGLAVRLMVDGVGSAGWVATVAPRLDRQGLRIAVYRPLPATLLIHHGLTWRWLLRALGTFRNINRRNHRKVCVIDGHVAWVGSINLECRHSKAVCGAEAWRDVAVRVEGEGAALYEAAFSLAWHHAWRLGRSGLLPALAWRYPHLRHSVDAPVRLNHGLIMRRRLFRDTLRRIRGARTRVWIANAYFVPHPALLAALEDAARSGRDVRLLLTARSDVWFMPAVAAFFLPRLVRAGVQVYLYTSSVLHTKTLLIDEWATVGSTNLNSRSLHHDLEADAVLTQPVSLATLAEIFAADVADSERLTSAETRMSWGRWLVGRSFLLVRRWL